MRQALCRMRETQREEDRSSPSSVGWRAVGVQASGWRGVGKELQVRQGQVQSPLRGTRRSWRARAAPQRRGHPKPGLEGRAGVSPDTPATRPRRASDMDASHAEGTTLHLLSAGKCITIRQTVHLCAGFLVSVFCFIIK